MIKYVKRQKCFKNQYNNSHHLYKKLLCLVSRRTFHYLIQVLAGPAKVTLWSLCFTCRLFYGFGSSMWISYSSQVLQATIFFFSFATDHLFLLVRNFLQKESSVKKLVFNTKVVILCLKRLIEFVVWQVLVLQPVLVANQPPLRNWNFSTMSCWIIISHSSILVISLLKQNDFLEKKED